MNEREAFLKALAENEDDTTTRLVYADWLEERGDPRAEFIRVQCALARPMGKRRRRAELKDREEALLAQHRKEWIKPLRGLGKHLHFRRGFVERMNISAQKFLDRGDALFRRAP
ncbi:MAG TPA: TIGR02996 domain-containing protein, partial [Gemmataceae bacterium]|nr:TIGR02996 domain-containing protein [Gemmataceae bacterium]